MENQITRASNMPESSLVKFKNLLNQDSIKQKFNEALGKKAPMFTSNLVTILSGSAELQKCEHMSIISSALMAASMDLPLTPGLGFAGIVPYWDSQSGMMKAQFQIMKKGYIQLAQRTGLMKTINVCEVYEGEIKKYNRFTGEYEFDEHGKTSDKIIGYVSYFRLVNGFEKFYYMPIEKLDKHARQFSKSFQRGKGKWADREQGGYEQMCEKTVLKLNLSTYAPMSNDINMMNAIIYDQAEIRDLDAKDYDYIDNENSEQTTEKEVLEIKPGTTITVDKGTQSRSQNLTSKASENIDKVQNNTVKQPQIITEEKSPIQGSDIPDKKESVSETKKEVYTESELKNLGTDALMEIVVADPDMKTAMEISNKRNVPSKLIGIILSKQNGTLQAIINEYKARKENTAKVEYKTPEQQAEEKVPENNIQEVAEGIKPNTEFESSQETESLSSNKYGLEIITLEERKADFKNVHNLFNTLSKLKIYPDKEDVLDNRVYESLIAKLPELSEFRNKEMLCRNATVEQVNLLLNSI